MKNKVLIIFKYPHGWNLDVINKFSNFYAVEFLNISDFKNKHFSEIINEINNVIKSKDIEIVVFDVDYFKFINFFFIERIHSKKKILITGDDFELHEMNSITASACDLILSCCPLSVLKYKEKGFEALVFHFEFSQIIKGDDHEKEIDVLFFGHLTADRKEILNYISNKGISLKNVGHEEKVTGLQREELLELISKSKIVLNLSKSRTTSVKNDSSENIYQFYYQFKGRIIVSGLRGTLCVSEYSPGQELLFNNQEVPTFITKEECANTLKKLLNNQELLEKTTNKFTSKVNELCEDKKNFEPIFNSIKKIDNKRVKLIKIPYWYLRIAAKQILLRNLQLSKINKTLIEFKVILSVIKNSNFLTQILIIVESLLNIFWYSLTSIIKPKK